MDQGLQEQCPPLTWASEQGLLSFALLASERPERRGCHCLYQLFGVAALAHRGLPPCRGFVREVPLAFPAPHLHAFGLWASLRYLVQVDR